ncbi:hypothetical protein ABZW11_03510 [Nonomuraea sp. NPDC004580]|uniref:hypothetical protein n=1 Tax=Nonomuraea sp. NPDC004580 TaxID=3154552 RepID=UPI0033A5158D
MELRTGRHLGDLPAVDVRALTAVSVRGHPVAVTADGRGVEVWDLTSRRRIGPRLYLPDAVTAIAVDETGHIVVCSGSGIAVFGLPQAQHAQGLPGPLVVPAGGERECSPARTWPR